jgi:hypothetical protein
MSACPLKADIRTDDQDVCFVPKAGIALDCPRVLVVVAVAAIWVVVAERELPWVAAGRNFPTVHGSVVMLCA